MRQGTGLAAFVLVVAGLLSIWLDDARQMQRVIGFATAGLAIASQRAVTAFVFYGAGPRPICAGGVAMTGRRINP